MANLEREVQLKFRVTPAERALIERKMAQLGTTNMAAYQPTRRVHETERFYDADLEELRQSYDGLWDVAQRILTSLAKLE